MKPQDIAKFRKGITKNIQGLSVGFADPATFMHTGCYALNYLISGDFFKGIPLEGKITEFAGFSGSGKSYIACGNLVKFCQHNDIFPVVVDTENAVDHSWLLALDVDPEDGLDPITGEPNGNLPKLMKVNITAVEDLAKFINEFVDEYKTNYAGLSRPERPKVLIVIDSLGMLVTSSMVEQAEAGTIQGDMGIKARKLSQLFRTTLAKIATENIGIVCTNHVFSGKDQYTPATIAGGQMVELVMSIIVQMDKLLLKEDEDGN